jgi:hypothetical protein
MKKEIGVVFSAKPHPLVSSRIRSLPAPTSVSILTKFRGFAGRQTPKRLVSGTSVYMSLEKTTMSQSKAIATSALLSSSPTTL